jgi:D-aminopeptidase
MVRLFLCLFALIPMSAAMADHPRARDLGIPFDGTPGALNAITDVEGITVGFSTIVEGEGDHAARTGVTAILPRGRDTLDRPAFAGWFSLNGNGEMTGTTWVEESGFLEGPVMITNTHSVGVVRDATIQWRVAQGDADASGYWWSLPVVAETWDGHLNDINGFHVHPDHVFAALDGAQGGPVAEGNVGGGTGMICYELKCGTGTASRRLSDADGGYTVGVLVQANHGLRDQLTVAGVPVGRELTTPRVWNEETGSIIIVVATDAPLLPHQLKRLARRASLGLARSGAISGNGSGDIFIAFSTANPDAGTAEPAPAAMMSNDRIDALFTATVQATDEAIVNALVAGREMTGAEGHHVPALDHDQLRAILARHNRLVGDADE